MGRHVKNALVTGLIDMQCPQKQLIINFSKSFFLFFSLSLSFFSPLGIMISCLETYLAERKQCSDIKCN